MINPFYHNLLACAALSIALISFATWAFVRARKRLNKEYREKKRVLNIKMAKLILDFANLRESINKMSWSEFVKTSRKI